jgi:PncC family amidohydrolase
VAGGADERSAEQLVGDIAAAANEGDLTIAVAESVTAGKVATALATGKGASDWFCGGVIAYSAHAKHGLLGVPEGPLITPQCADAMARGAAARLEADVALATTGVGGPESVEGHPAGTVWYGFVTAVETGTCCEHFDGDPEQVVDAATRRALRLLRDRLQTVVRPEPTDGSG